jgi:hypothetical protein
LRDIRWSIPALKYFKEEYGPTPEDIREIIAALVDVRDHEDRPRTPVDPDEFPELEAIGPDLCVCESEGWRVVYLWLEEEIEVCHIVSRLD